MPTNSSRVSAASAASGRKDAARGPTADNGLHVAHSQRPQVCEQSQRRADLPAVHVDATPCELREGRRERRQQLRQLLCVDCVHAWPQRNGCQSVRQVRRHV